MICKINSDFFRCALRIVPLLLFCLLVSSCVARTFAKTSAQSEPIASNESHAQNVCDRNASTCICAKEYCAYVGGPKYQNPITDQERATFRSLLEKSKDPNFILDAAAQEFLARNDLIGQYENHRAAHAFFKPVLALIYDREYQESKARQKFSKLADLVSSVFWNKSNVEQHNQKSLKELGLEGEQQELKLISGTPGWVKKSFAQIKRILPSVSLIFALTLTGFIGFMNAQCYGIAEEKTKDPVEFVQYEDSLDPKTQFEMYFFDCAANTTKCIHMAVRVGDKVYHGSGPRSGTGYSPLPLPDHTPLANWNGDAMVFNTSYEDFRDGSWGLSSKNSLTSIRIQLPEEEISNLKKYYASRLWQSFNYWAFPPVSTCTTVARDAIETSSVKIPPVVQDFPGADEAYFKLLKLFGDNRIVRIVRSNGEIAYGMTPEQI